MIVIRVQYWEQKLVRWITYCDASDMEHAKSWLTQPIVGKPHKRIAEYDKTGVRKIKYRFVREIEFLEGEL